MRWLVLALLPLLTTPAIACEGEHEIEEAVVWLFGNKLTNGNEILYSCSGTFEDEEAEIVCYD